MGLQRNMHSVETAHVNGHRDKQWDLIGHKQNQKSVEHCTLHYLHLLSHQQEYQEQSGSDRQREGDALDE